LLFFFRAGNGTAFESELYYGGTASPEFAGDNGIAPRGENIKRCKRGREEEGGGRGRLKSQDTTRMSVLLQE